MSRARRPLQLEVPRDISSEQNYASTRRARYAATVLFPEMTKYVVRSNLLDGIIQRLKSETFSPTCVGTAYHAVRMTCKGMYENSAP